MRLAHRTPGFKAISKRLPPSWFFRWSIISATVSLNVSAHRRRSIQPIRQILAGHRHPADAYRIAKDYVIYRNWLNQLEYAWQNWAERCAPKASIRGESYLKRALDQGKGVALLSAHCLGFSRFVAPLLAERHYRIVRAGSDIAADRRELRWGRSYMRNWQYINYHGNLWGRAAALNRMRGALKRNEIVHMSILWLPAGDPALQFDIFSARVFLDPTMFKIMAEFDCPRLPCIALCDARGGISLRIEPPLSPDGNQAMQEFKEYYGNWVNTRPELMREWRKIGAARHAEQ